MIKATDLKIGSVIEYKDSTTENWVKSVIYKISDSFVWFKGSGFSRINKNTFENWPTLFRIVSI